MGKRLVVALYAEARSGLRVIYYWAGGQMKSGRVTTFKPADVKGIRAGLHQSQEEFALMIGVSVATLRNWEQGRRTPGRPALALLRVAARNPRTVADALHRPTRRGAA